MTQLLLIIEIPIALWCKADIVCQLWNIVLGKRLQLVHISMLNLKVCFRHCVQNTSGPEETYHNAFGYVTHVEILSGTI